VRLLVEIVAIDKYCFELNNNCVLLLVDVVETGKLWLLIK